MGWVGPRWDGHPFISSAKCSCWGPPPAPHRQQAPGGSFFIPGDSQMRDRCARGPPRRPGPEAEVWPHICREPPAPGSQSPFRTHSLQGQARSPSQRPSPGPQCHPNDGALPLPVTPRGDGDSHPVQGSQPNNRLRGALLPCDLHPPATVHPPGPGPRAPVLTGHGPWEPLLPFLAATLSACPRSGASPPAASAQTQGLGEPDPGG